MESRAIADPSGSSIKKAASRMMMAMFAVSALIAAGGAGFYVNRGDFSEALPFAAGVAMAAALNAAKIVLLKRDVAGALGKDPVSAKHYLQLRYFMRLLLTAGVLVAAALLPDAAVNLFGAVFGVFALHAASYSMRYFMRRELADEVLAQAAAPAGAAEAALEDMEKIVSGYEEEHEKEKEHPKHPECEAGRGGEGAAAKQTEQE